MQEACCKVITEVVRTLCGSQVPHLTQHVGGGTEAMEGFVQTAWKGLPTERMLVIILRFLCHLGRPIHIFTEKDFVGSFVSSTCGTDNYGHGYSY